VLSDGRGTGFAVTIHALSVYFYSDIRMAKAYRSIGYTALSSWPERSRALGISVLFLILFVYRLQPRSGRILRDEHGRGKVDDRHAYHEDPP